MPYLKFVTNIRHGISVMWRNFRFLYMINVEKFYIFPHLSCWYISDFPTDVENSEITPHLEKFQISPENRCFLRFMLFCSNLRTFGWSGEKLSPKVCIWRKNDKCEVCGKSLLLWSLRPRKVTHLNFPLELALKSWYLSVKVISSQNIHVT